MKQLKLRVDGITCPGCATDAESVLKNTDGIVSAEVSCASGTVTVSYRPDEIDEKQLTGVVKRMGLKIR